MGILDDFEVTVEFLRVVADEWHSIDLLSQDLDAVIRCFVSRALAGLVLVAQDGFDFGDRCRGALDVLDQSALHALQVERGQVSALVEVKGPQFRREALVLVYKRSLLQPPADGLLSAARRMRVQ